DTDQKYFQRQCSRACANRRSGRHDRHQVQPLRAHFANPNGASRPAYSCEENCPTGALVRVNPQEYFGEIEKTLGLVFRDQTHAIGRNIHQSDPVARLWHIGGIIGTLAITMVIAWAALHYG